MNLLAIDTSTELASVALLLGDELLYKEQGGQRTHAQFLLTLIDDLLVDSGVLINQLDGIVFGCGPGSFTGLRIACSTAKGLAYAHDLKLIPVSSLTAIAWAARKHFSAPETPVLAVLDARMQEMYWAYYPQGQWTAEEKVSSVSDIILPENQPIVLAGVGIDEYGANFSKTVKTQVTCQLNIHPGAAAMIELAKALDMPTVLAEDAQPVYVRNKVT